MPSCTSGLLPLALALTVSERGVVLVPHPQGTFPWLSAVPSPVVALLGLVLCVLAGIGPYVEVAFFHRASRSLLLTDAVVLVPPTPPPVVSPDALLAAAENGLAVQVLSASSGLPVPKVTVEDTPGFRNLGMHQGALPPRLHAFRLNARSSLETAKLALPWCQASARLARSSAPTGGAPLLS